MLVKVFKNIYRLKKTLVFYDSFCSLSASYVSLNFCLLMITLLHFQAAMYFLLSGTDLTNSYSHLLKKICIISTISHINSFHRVVETFYRNAADAFVLILYSRKFLPIQFWRILPGELDESPIPYFKLHSIYPRSGNVMSEIIPH